MIKKVVTALVLTISLGACAPLVIEKKESSREHLIQRLKLSVAKVGGAHGHGSGFYISVLGRPIMITNAHVCEMYNEPDPSQYLEFYNHAQSHDFSVLKQDKDIDLCAIKFTPQPGLQPLPLAFEEHPFEEVIVMGYPVYNPLTAVFGFTGDTVADELHPGFQNTYVSTNIYPGNSGSAVVNTRLQVIGVISEGDNYTFRGRMVTFEHLKAFVLGLY